MGLTKNYLRYRHVDTFGLVAASQAGASIKFLHIDNTEDRYLAVPANENVFIWNLKTKQLHKQLEYGQNADSAEVTVLDTYHGGHRGTNLLAVGYANGHVKVFEYETGALKVTFTGHRTAISALQFDKDGSRLASGGKDCNIVLWDMVSEKGLFALKGHKNVISKIAFLYNDENQRDVIVSSSVDAVTTLKFWDLQTQHCFCTIPAQSGGIWSFAIIKNGTRLIAGSTGAELKVYSLEFLSEAEQTQLKLKYTDEGIEEETGLASSELEYGLRVKHLGNVLRNSTSISNRVQDIVLDEQESFMICHSIDKNIELYGIRDDEEALSYAKKQAKKAKRKLAKRKDMGDINEEEENTSEETYKVSSLDCLEPQRLVDCEINRKYENQKLQDKVKAVAVTKLKSKNKRYYKIATMLSSNKIESYLVDMESKEAGEFFTKSTKIENFSHRTDVRAVSISQDNKLVLSASGESAKVWNLYSSLCTTTIDTGYSLCCAFSNAQNMTLTFDNRFAFVGTKQGQIQILDIANATVIKTIDVGDSCKPINSIFPLPDKTGIVCGGEDKIVRFYKYVWRTTEEDVGSPQQTILDLEEDRQLPFEEGITCVKVSANNNLLAVALLDSTVRVHFLDTFKYFLTMYGHKFPVTTMDLSDDNTLIATGSPDKNIKIWGLDFGDCHKSIFAHDDAITCVKFVPRTHYIFSCGRDKSIKQYDCDHFLKIQTLRKHQAEVWCMDVSPNGKYVVTASHDKSLRLYEKTEDILVPSEEEETERELEDERNTFEKQEPIVVGEVDLETGFATKKTIETVKSTDQLIEAIDVFEIEQQKERDYKAQCELADKNGEPMPVEPEKEPLLMTAMTTDYNRFLLEILRRIRSSELEEILLTLPFDYVRKLLIILVIFLERKWDIELMVRCATFLLKVNFGQIAASPLLVPVVYKLNSVIQDRTSRLRDCAGYNMMALEHLSINKKYSSTKV